LLQGVDIFDEFEMQTVEVVGDFYNFKSHAQHLINLHALTDQFKQVLRRFSGLRRAPWLGLLRGVCFHLRGWAGASGGCGAIYA